MPDEHPVKRRTKKERKGGVLGSNFPNMMSILGVVARVERQF